MNMLGKAIAIASTAFSHKVDKAGKPYILHCLRVMNAVDQHDEDLMIIAVLHDLLEDCPNTWSLMKLAELGFNHRVIKGISYMTHEEGVDYEVYIKTIANNPDAIKVKLADLKDNSDITRLKGLRKKDHDRMEKYHRAFIYLSN
jgi:(p)ppGpp synthase/HD superfamily hydrolase